MKDAVVADVATTTVAVASEEASEEASAVDAAVYGLSL